MPVRVDRARDRCLLLGAGWRVRVQGIVCGASTTVQVYVAVGIGEGIGTIWATKICWNSHLQSFDSDWVCRAETGWYVLSV